MLLALRRALLISYGILFLQLVQSTPYPVNTLWDYDIMELIIESSMRNEFARLGCDEQLIMAGPSTAYARSEASGHTPSLYIAN